jgi:hypothetical protein
MMLLVNMQLLSWASTQLFSLGPGGISSSPGGNLKNILESNQLTYFIFLAKYY